MLVLQLQAICRYPGRVRCQSFHRWLSFLCNIQSVSAQLYGKMKKLAKDVFAAMQFGLLIFTADTSSHSGRADNLNKFFSRAIKAD
jgi:hypothetical protein